jgi:parallel beta-helix repeat protein
VTSTGGNGIELYDNAGGSIIGNTIRNNRFHGVAASGVASFGSVGTIIEDNTIEGCTTAGIYCTNSEVTPATGGGGIQIKGNRILSVASGATAGIYITDSSGGAGPTDVSIVSNHVAEAGGSVPGILVDCTGVTRATIHDNSCILNGGGGIVVEAARATITANKCINNSQVGVGSRNGISVGAGAATPDCVIMGNECSDTQGTHTQQFGIYIGASATNTSVIGNRAMGTTSWGVFDAGTGTRLLSNRQDFAGGFAIPDTIGALTHNGTTAGFFGTTPVTKESGVAVTAAAIHAALVRLGLIAA